MGNEQLQWSSNWSFQSDFISSCVLAEVWAASAVSVSRSSEGCIHPSCHVLQSLEPQYPRPVQSRCRTSHPRDAVKSHERIPRHTCLHLRAQVGLLFQHRLCWEVRLYRSVMNFFSAGMPSLVTRKVVVWQQTCTLFWVYAQEPSYLGDLWKPINWHFTRVGLKCSLQYTSPLPTIHFYRNFALSDRAIWLYFVNAC